MSVAIGEFLTCMREEVGISQKELCEGICKVSAYSNYERNERVPDFLTLNLLLERMGHTIMSLAVYISSEEAEYLQWRTDTSNALRDKQYERLAGLIGQEPKDCISLNEAMYKSHGNLSTKNKAFHCLNGKKDSLLFFFVSAGKGIQGKIRGNKNGIFFLPWAASLGTLVPSPRSKMRPLSLRKGA